MIYALNDIRVFYARSEPDIWKDVLDLCGHELRHSLRALGENLVIVARRFTHCPPNFKNEAVAHVLMEKIAHRVYENLARLFPTMRNC